MSLLQIAAVLLCVALIAVGQILFKYVGLLSVTTPGGWSVHVVMSALAAFAVYGTATLVWIYLLRTIPLTKAYPFMALSFVLVPLGAAVLFGERLNGAYTLGLVLIVAGVLIVSRAG